jgi:hypothetical protein
LCSTDQHAQIIELTEGIDLPALADLPQQQMFDGIVSAVFKKGLAEGLPLAQPAGGGPPQPFIRLSIKQVVSNDNHMLLAAATSVTDVWGKPLSSDRQTHGGFKLCELCINFARDDQKERQDTLPIGLPDGDHPIIYAFTPLVCGFGRPTRKSQVKWSKQLDQGAAMAFISVQVRCAPPHHGSMWCRG